MAIMPVFPISYAVLLPFSLVSGLGYYAIPITMFVIFAFLGLELMAEEIEDPFGLDCNNMPTRTIEQKIKENVFEILELSQVPSEPKAELYEKIF